MRAYKVCEQIIDCLLSEGYRLQITKRDIETCIMKLRGIDPRTVEKWLKALIRFDYITQKAPNVYEFNPFKVPEVLKLIKKEPQVKLQ